MYSYNFSIIIPHKDIPSLLTRCIESIPHRDDIQIIVVDDNSKNSNFYLSQYPILSKPNVEFYQNKDGKGAGHVRNVGLSHAKGKWIIFADSDDTFTENFNQLLDIVKIDSIHDLIYFDVISKDSDTLDILNESEWISNHIKDIALNGITDQNKYGVLVPWSKVIKFDLIKQYNIRFEEVPCSNDTAFSAMIAFHAKNVLSINLACYCWMQRKGSLWRNKNYSWYLTRMKVLARIALFMKKNKDLAGYTYFRTSSLKYMNDLAFLSKIQHIKACFIYSIMMHDYNILFKHIPYLFLHYSRLL